MEKHASIVQRNLFAVWVPKLEFVEEKSDQFDRRPNHEEKNDRIGSLSAGFDQPIELHLRLLVQALNRREMLKIHRQLEDVEFVSRELSLEELLERDLGIAQRLFEIVGRQQKFDHLGFQLSGGEGLI